MRKGPMSGIWVMLIILLSLTACANPSPAPTTSPPVQESVQPEVTPAREIEITLGLWGLQAPSEGSDSVSKTVYDEILNRFGIKVTPWVLEEDWSSQIDAAAANGVLPDFFVQNLEADKMNIKLWSESGVIRSIPEEMWIEYPALYSVMEWVSSYGVMSNGEMYYIPRTDLAFDQTGGQSVALYYRSDWAGKLGYSFEGEVTWEQFVNLLYDYARGDPDGNGSIDTRALTLTGDGLGMLYQIFFMDFGVRDWVLEDGQWIPGLLSDRAREALKWMNQLYRDGIIDPDYASQTEDDAYNKFASGQAAMLAADGQRVGAMTLRTQYWDTYNPNTVIEEHVALLPQPRNPYGVSYNELNTETSCTLVNAQVTDEKLDRALALFDWLYTKEGLAYMQYGRQGVDYEMGDQGAVSLLTGADGVSRTFAQLNPEMGALASLSTWNREGLSDLESQNTFDLTCQQRLEDLWWSNNWHRTMFTEFMYTPQLVTFDLKSLAAGKLAYMMMMSTDIDTDWEQYLAECMSEFNTQDVIDEVNEYARENGFTTEE